MKLRTLLAVALLAPASAFAAAPPPPPKSKPASSAQPAAAPSSSSSSGGLSIGGFIGYETADVSGLALRFDGELPFQDLSPQVRLSWVGSVGYSHLTTSSFGGGDFTANVFKFVPAARVTVPINPQFDVFGDAGLGIAYVSATVDFPGVPGLIPAFSQSDSTVNLMMRFGVGGWYHVSPALRVGGMIEFDPIFGDFGFSGASSQNTFNILFGLMYRL